MTARLAIALTLTLTLATACTPTKLDGADGDDKKIQDRPLVVPPVPTEMIRYDDVEIPKNPDGSAKVWVTPEDFGAVGNDGKDDSDAFDKLAAAMEQDVGVMIPARRYHLSRTWKLPYVKGGRIVGAGGFQHHHMKKKAALQGASSDLYWIGKEGGVMIQMIGSNSIIESLNLFGQDKAGVGFYVIKPKGAKGIGTGKASVRGMSVLGCNTGIRLGNGGANVDNILWEYIYIHECGTGLLLDTQMAMGHYFAYLQLRSVKTAIWVRRGGDLVVRGGLNVGTDVFLKVGDKDGTAPGRNNGMILIEGIKADAQNVDLTWLDVATPTDCAITFNNCHQAWTKDGTRYPRKWIVRGPTKLAIRDCINVFGTDSFVLEPHHRDNPEVYTHNPETGDIKPTRKPRMPNVLLDRCRVDFGSGPKDWIDVDKGHYTFKVRDCFRGTGEPIEDAKTR
jgi:hypothetical protein